MVLKKSLSELYTLAVIAALCIGVFILDWNVAFGIFVWVLYSIPLTIVYSRLEEKYYYPITGIVGILTYVCLMKEQVSYIPIYFPLFNRSAGIFLFFLIMYLLKRQKKIAEEKNKLNIKLNQSIRAASIGTWELDMINNQMHWDESMFELYDLRKENFTEDYKKLSETLLSMYGEEFHEEQKNFYVRAEMGDRLWEGRYSIITSSKEKKYIKSTAQFERDKTGKAIRAIGANIDITKELQAYEELTKRTDELNKFFEITPDLLCIANTNGYFTRLNKQWKKH